MKKLQKDLVSIIMPLYNGKVFLKKTLDSIVNQDYKTIELIIVDDCSSDNPIEVIEQYKNQILITYVKLETNSGAAVARNIALKMALGEYVAFLDSDDIWYPNKLKKQIEIMKKNNQSFCFTAIEMIDEEDKVIKNKRPIREKVDYKFLLKNTMIATSSVVIDISKVGEFTMPLLRSGQDYATWLMILRNGIVAYGINEVLVSYRKRSQSLSSQKFKNFKKVWNIQTNYEKINPFSAAFNTICYAVNAWRKHKL